MLVSVRGSAPGVTSLSTMIAVRPRPDEAQALHPDDPGDLHCTLCFLGDYPGDLTDLAGCLAQVGAGHAPLEGAVSGVGVFDDNGNGHPQLLLPSAPGLTELRVAVTEALAQAGVDYGRQFGFHPHMTVGYSETPDPPGAEALGAPLHFDAISIVRGNAEEMQVPLTGAKPLTASSAQSAQGDGGGSDTALDHGKPGEEPLGAPRTTFASRGERPAPALALRGSAAAGTVLHHNRVVEAARARADELEPRLAALLEPIFHAAGSDAARTFTARTTVTAGAAWSPPAGDELIDVPALAQTLRTKTDPVRLAAIESTMGATLEPHGLSFDVTNPFTAQALAQSGSQVTAIAETTRANVMRSVREAYDQGLSIPDTAKLIRAGMRDATPARATLIARTELVGAVNSGSLAATRIVEEAIGVAFNKQWLTAPGAIYPRHELYEGLNGQTTTLDGTFDVGGYDLGFPGDPDGPPEEVCNCRCALAYVEGGSVPQAAPGEEPPLSVDQEARSVYQGGSIATDSQFDVDQLAVLDAHGENPDLDAEYTEMSNRLQRQISAADWSKADPGAESEAYDAAVRAGADTIKTLADDQGRLLGIVDYNVPADVGEIRAAIESITEDLAAAAPADRDYVQQILDELEKKLAQALNPDAVVGVNHLASTGIENGIGARLMKEVARAASAQGRGVGLNSLDSARGFYERLGMTERAPGDFYWTPEQARQFAEGELRGQAPEALTVSVVSPAEADSLVGEVLDWPETAQEVAGHALLNAADESDAITQIVRGADGTLRAVSATTESADNVIISNLASRGGGGEGTYLLRHIATQAAQAGKGLELVALDDSAAAYWERQGFETVGDSARHFRLSPEKTRALAAGSAPPPPLPPAPILPRDSLSSLIENVEARPWAHLKDGPLTTQIGQSRKVLREIYAKQARGEALTARDEAQLVKHEKKLADQLREKEIRSGKPQREFAHWTNERLLREVEAQRKAINLAHMAGSDPATLAAARARLRALTKEQSYRIDHPAARIREADLVAPAVELPAPPNDRIASLRQARETFVRKMRDPGGLLDPLVSNEERAMAEQRITALGADVDAEIMARLGSLSSQEARRQAFSEVMADIRPMGKADQAQSAFRNITGSLAARREIDRALAFYPRDWVEPLKAQTVRAKITQRGHFSPGDNTIALSGDSAVRVAGDSNMTAAAVHEVGHMMEFNVPAIRNAERAFYERRTAGDVVKTLPWSKKEFYRQDEWTTPYMGRDYGASASEVGTVAPYRYNAFYGRPGTQQFYEILTMGMESLITGGYVLDAEMRNFILGLLATV